MERTLPIVELATEELRSIVGECELTGRRTIFERDGKPAAILISYDEYLALRETIAITADSALRARIRAAEAQAERGALLEMEDLGRDEG